MTDLYESDEWRRFARSAQDDLVPKLRDSSVTVSLMPSGQTDIKFALELGLSVMMDKPIIAVIAPGTRVPAKVLLIADEIVEADPGDPKRTSDRITEALRRQLGDDDFTM